MKEIFVRPERCIGCRSCEIACAVEHSGSKNLFGALTDKPEPRKRLYVETIGGQRMPLLCHHCDKAPCVAVCRTGATSKDGVTGIVTKDSDKCVGCWVCATICTYGVVGREKEERIALKCDRCKDLDIPACVNACPTGTLIFREESQLADIGSRDENMKTSEIQRSRTAPEIQI